MFYHASASLESLDVGKPLRESYADIDDSRGALLHCARLIREQGVEVVDLGNSTLGRIDRLPVGVVGGILPWNYPILMFIWKLAPAVAAGMASCLAHVPFPALHTSLQAVPLSLNPLNSLHCPLLFCGRRSLEIGMGWI